MYLVSELAYYRNCCRESENGFNDLLLGRLQTENPMCYFYLINKKNRRKSTLMIIKFIINKTNSKV